MTKKQNLDPRSIECNFSDIFAMCGNVKNINAVRDEIERQLHAAYETACFGMATAMPTVEVTAKAEQKTKKASAKTATKKATKKSVAKNERKEREYKDQVAVTDTKALKKLGLKFEKYSEKSYVLKGETKCLADYLRNQMSLKYRPSMGGWLVPASKANDVAKTLKVAL